MTSYITDKRIAELDIAMDRSKSPSTVSVNATEMFFESESDAEFVFDLLNRIKNSACSRILTVGLVRRSFDSLQSDLHYLALGIED
jgi:hypothetical protein